MSDEWLIETLAELRAYARQRQLVALAAHLEQTIALAHLEIASIPPAPPARPSDDSGD